MDEEEKIDPFWDTFPIPFQEEATDFDFVNAVTVSRQFIKAIAEVAHLAGMTEILANQLADKQVELDRTERDLTILRRKVLATNYDKITKSASTEVQEAFLLKCVTGTSEEALFNSLESKREGIVKFMEERSPRLVQLKGRMKAIENKMEWAREYLNVEKLLYRVTDRR